MPESSQTIWKPLFWLVFASLIAVYLLYDHHSDHLQKEIGDEHQSQRSLSRSLDDTKDALSKANEALKAAEAEINALKSSHAAQLDSIQDGHRAAIAAMQETHEQRLADLSKRIDDFSTEQTLLTAETEAWKRAKDKLEQDLRKSVEASEALEAQLAETAETRRELEVKLAADDATIAELNALLNRANQTEALLNDKLERGAATQDRLEVLVAKEESAILELQEKLVATTQSRAELERLLATTNDGASTPIEVSSKPTEPDPEQQALQARIEQLEADLEATKTERDRLAVARAENQRGDAEDQAMAELRIESLSEELETAQATVAQQAAASKQKQTQLRAELDAAKAALDELKQSLTARDDEHQSKLANYETQLADAESALQAMRREMQEREKALESAREQGNRLRKDAVAQASDQVHDFYAQFAALGAQLTDRGLLVNLSSDNIRFPSGSAVLPEDAGPTLSRIADILLDHPELRVQIEGHTDSSGNSESNLKLSEQRAASVRDALIELGVESARLGIEGLGSATPIASNATNTGRQRNRRVELYVVRDNES